MLSCIHCSNIQLDLLPTIARFAPNCNLFSNFSLCTPFKSKIASLQSISTLIHLIKTSLSNILTLDYTTADRYSILLSEPISLKQSSLVSKLPNNLLILSAYLKKNVITIAQVEMPHSTSNSITISFIPLTPKHISTSQTLSTKRYNLILLKLTTPAQLVLYRLLIHGTILPTSIF